MAFPELNVAGTPANPQPGGLYAAATVIELPEPARLSTGVTVDWVNSGPHGIWTGTDTTGGGLEGDEPDGIPDDSKGGTRTAPTDFETVVVWAADDATFVGTSQREAGDRARQLLRITEPLDVETHLAAVLAALSSTAPTDGVGDPFVDVIGELEHELGKTGVAGVIHASRRHAALAARYGLIVAGPMGRLLTPLGNAWAFGGGYSSLGSKVIATGPVEIRQSPVVVAEGHALATNDRLFVAEREVTVSYEFTPISRTITPETP